jgi:hypothetical protein
LENAMTVKTVQERAVESWLRQARPTTGLAALPAHQQEQARERNRRLRERRRRGNV